MTPCPRSTAPHPGYDPSALESVLGAHWLTVFLVFRLPLQAPSYANNRAFQVPAVTVQLWFYSTYFYPVSSEPRGCMQGLSHSLHDFARMFVDIASRYRKLQWAEAVGRDCQQSKSSATVRA